MKVNITFNLEKELLLNKTKSFCKKVGKIITPVTDSMSMGLLLFIGIAWVLIIPVTFFLVEEIVTKAWLSIVLGTAIYFVLELISRLCRWLKDW